MRTVRILFLLAAAASVFAAGEAAAQAPIKIGFLSPLSGAIAAAGKDMYSGCELYWQESGWQMAGRKVEVILEDNEGLPATALTKLRKLVENDRRAAGDPHASSKCRQENTGRALCTLSCL
jgi:branched-chain amino acid transport system substrate-binding protein